MKCIYCKKEIEREVSLPESGFYEIFQCPTCNSILKIVNNEGKIYYEIHKNIDFGFKEKQAKILIEIDGQKKEKKSFF